MARWISSHSRTWIPRSSLVFVTVLLASTENSAGEGGNVQEGSICKPGQFTGRVLFKLARQTDDQFLHSLEAAWRSEGHQQSTIKFNHLDKYGNFDIARDVALHESTALKQFLYRQPDVQFAEEDACISAFSAAVFSNNHTKRQWGRSNLGLNDASTSGLIYNTVQHKAIGSSDIVICVIDSGIDMQHPALKANLWRNDGEIPHNNIDDDGNGIVDDYHGVNAMDDTGDISDEFGHGTHLSGIIGAKADSHNNIAGVAPNVKIMTCKFLDKWGNGQISDAARCLSYAVKMGANITLNSWGGPSNWAVLKDAVQSADSAGRLYVTAAGNHGIDIDKQPVYPSSYEFNNMITVISRDLNGLSKFTNFGAQSADIAAPGSDIFSTLPNSSYGYKNGSSQAAAYVAGAAALILANYKGQGYGEINATIVKQTIMKNARIEPALKQTCKTGGSLDARAALSHLVGI